MTMPSKPTILIVDNDEAVAKSLATRLDSLGYRCLTVSNGTDGVEVFEFCNIDLTITDLNMPGMDGIAVAGAIRARSAIPIIVMTGYQKAYWKELHGINNVVVLAKPFSATAMIELVEAELAPWVARCAA